MSPPERKMAKIEPSTGKLWTSEERMFGEKIFYLNKSTTKHVIVGFEPKNLDPVVKICDRVTGNNITIKKMNFPEFTRVAVSILQGTYTLENGFIKNASDLCGIKFKSSSNGIWELAPVDLKFSSILIHHSSFKTLLRIERLILKELMYADSAFYLSYIEELRENSIEMDINEIFEYLYEQTTKFTTKCMEYQILSDLICNFDSYSKLNEFGSNFFYRNSYKK